MSLNTQQLTSYDITQIINNLYIGDSNIAMKKDYIYNLGITHIVVAGEQLYTPYKTTFQYLHIKIKDSKSQRIQKYFDEAYEFIQGAIKSNKKVLVHCAYGVSRSSAIVIAYLIKKCRARYEDVFTFVKSKRYQIRPNEGFANKLRQFSKIIKQSPNNNNTLNTKVTTQTRLKNSLNN